MIIMDIDVRETVKEVDSKVQAIKGVTPDDFADLISICNSEHLSYCNCQKDKVDEKIKILWQGQLEDLKLKKLIDNEEVVAERKDYCKAFALKSIGKECELKEIRCPFEKIKIERLMSHFMTRYDLKDPRVIVVIESLLQQMLSAHRMQLHSNAKGILSIWYDKQGNKRYNLNPVEEIKLKYDEAKIQAIATLDRMIEGDKLSISSVTVKDINKIFDIPNTVEGVYKTIE